MATYGDDATLTKIAVFGICMSILCTVGIGLLLVETGDYDYDQITAYRNDLIRFSGESMVDQSPWVLTEVYTPWDPSYPITNIEGEENGHTGWLYGQKITTYPYIGQATNIKLDVNQKSSHPLTYEKNRVNETFRTGEKWYVQASSIFAPLIKSIGTWTGLYDPYTYTTVTANSWDFQGYRYIFDPVLPFKSGTSAVDGSLSLVWYSQDGQEGLSGGLDVYGGNVRLASFAAIDIINDYQTTSGHATVYDFDFEGIHLNLSVRFDQDAINAGKPLIDAFRDGNWSMAISSTSVGNFMDLENSTSFTNTAGSMVDTFVKIYTFNLPNLHNQWAALVLWLLVGLPMTIAMLCVTLRTMQSLPFT